MFNVTPSGIAIGIVCLIAFWYARRHFDQLLDEHDIDQTPTRKLLVLTLALAAAILLSKLLGAVFG